MFVDYFRKSLLVLQGLDTMLVLPHLLIHLSLLGVFLTDFEGVIMRLLYNPLYDGVVDVSSASHLVLA